MFNEEKQQNYPKILSEQVKYYSGKRVKI